jgi:hypothetical protein
MKKFNYLIAVIFIASLSFVSCEKSDSKKEKPGQIPGMGNEGGELQAEAYVFHQDLTFGTLEGVDVDTHVTVLKSAKDELDVVIGEPQGSGDQVMIEIMITNNHPTDCRSAWFRAGTVFDCNLEGYQNGILLAPVNICVPPDTTKTFTLYLYCLNRGWENSDETVIYENLGVTTSQEVLDFIGLLMFKKVNYEHYLYYPEVDFDYNEVKDRLQDILWKITNGSGMDASDLEFINNLPDLPEGVFPEYIYDLTIPLPDCWCIDECEVVENSGALSYVAFVIACDGPLHPIPDGDFYETAGITFEVITEVPGGGGSNGYIKFEDVEDDVQLGEDGQIETGVFTFWAPCHDEQITVTTKNKDEITVVLDITEVGQAVVMVNGFIVEFISVASENGGYTYVFNVVSDSCPGSNK